MLCDNTPEENREQNFNGLEPNDSIQKTLIFIESCLPIFKVKYKSIKPEDGLTQELVYILDNRCRSKLPICGFSTEHMENTSKGNSRRDDIGVRAIDGITIDAISYADNKPFLVLEAKRLDSKIGKSREKEYVVGRWDGSKYSDSGGIERFKKEVHGVGLNFVGMIGYVQTDNFETWFEKINGWIEDEIKAPMSKELNWDIQDKLEYKKKSILNSSFISKHQCKSKTIDIYHIWINLVK